MPTISIVMPTYNNIKFIDEAIKSILEQTCQDFELIVIDDGSSDGTREYLDNLKDSRIQVFHKENGGTGSALNLGFEKVSGIWWTWVSSDNIYRKDFLRALASAFHSNPKIDFVYSDFEYMDNDGKHMFDVIRPNYTQGSMLNGCSVGICFMYKKELAITVGKYDTELNCQDYDMWLRMEEKGIFYHLPGILGSYRHHGNTVTCTKKSDHLECIARAKHRRGIE